MALEHGCLFLKTDNFIIDSTQITMVSSTMHTTVKVVLKGNGSKGLRPQLVHCAPFPSIAPYFRML